MLKKERSEATSVVDPLEKYFRSAKRSGADWKIMHRPKHSAGAKGWDLHVARKNQDLLFEAKYLKTQSFKAALEGFILAPLVTQQRPMPRNAVFCWALGCGWLGPWDYMPRMCQCFLDYFARNVKFWKSYTRILKVKYIFFVNERGKVARISFAKMLNSCMRYDPSLKTEMKKQIAIKLLNPHFQ